MFMVQVQDHHGSGYVHRDVKRCRLVACLSSGKVDQNTVTCLGQHKIWLGHLGRKEQSLITALRGDNGVNTAQERNGPLVSDVMNYIAYLFDKCLKYRTINCARSALSSTLKTIDGF
jgi:hypothetical protein